MNSVLETVEAVQDGRRFLKPQAYIAAPSVYSTDGIVLATRMTN
jgi:hypothetical protein